MFRKAWIFGVALLLAGMLGLPTPDAAARPPAGGGARGGHAGAYRGGYTGGYRGYYGGYRGYYGGYRGYYGAYRPYYNYGYYRPYYNYGYYRPYYGYGYYRPYYGSAWWWGGGLLGLGSYAPTYYNVPPYYGVPAYYGDVPYAVPYSGAGAPLLPSDASLTAPTGAPARIVVNVPAGARVSFNGSDIASAGTSRQFTTPPLAPDGQFVYRVEARWEENGKPVTQTQQVVVSGGAEARVTFPIDSVTNR